jgi:hypothetical protein
MIGVGHCVVSQVDRGCPRLRQAGGCALQFLRLKFFRPGQSMSTLCCIIMPRETYAQRRQGGMNERFPRKESASSRRRLRNVTGARIVAAKVTG